MNAKFKVYQITKAGEVSRRHDELFKNHDGFTATELLTAAIFSQRIDHTKVKIFMEFDGLQVGVDTDGILKTADDLTSQAGVFCRNVNQLVAGYVD